MPGIEQERGDLTVTSQPFVEEFDGFVTKWYKELGLRSIVEKLYWFTYWNNCAIIGVDKTNSCSTASTNSVMELMQRLNMAELAQLSERLRQKQ